MQIFILVIELIGTVAFSLSGASVALEKKMDLFGVAMLGLVTACGGGVIRDLVLGITPPTTFENPIYAMVAVDTAIIAFLPEIYRWTRENPQKIERVLLVMDSIGLGAFTAVGIHTAFTVQPDGSYFLMIFVGVITGIGGGILRDTLAGTTPYVFVKHFYAMASLIGAIVAVAVKELSGSSLLALSLCAVTTCVLRLCAAHYRWSLPRYR